jgi:hypothetical protein
MKIRTIATVLCLLTIGGTAFAADEDGFVSMFNGRDLTGWEGISGAWLVQDGAITGQSTIEKPCEKSHYLYYTGAEPGDFILRCEIKLVGGNSGIQFRSQKRPNFDTDGYQADFDAANKWTGCLYQHKRGAVVLRGRKATVAQDGTRDEQEFAPVAELAKKIKDSDWNEYEIIAIGSNIALKLNNALMCEVEDNDVKLACKRGVIALQMHRGPPMKVQFRNLRIKILDEES